MKKHLKGVLAGVILVATAIIFGLYIKNHPEVIRELSQISPAVIVVLLLLYLVWWAALAVVLQISLQMYNKKMPAQENILLSAYSSLLNFFGPGQSGPGLRAIYLKKRHNLNIKSYIFATLIYYACYSVISAWMLFAGSRPWWQTVLFVVAAGAGSLAVLRWYSKSKMRQGTGPRLKLVGWMFVATSVQMVSQLLIYFVELRSVMPGVGFGQVLTYTGAANFTLFVALTPGAIGIREAFLVFTNGLHHISSTVIVAANIIDRSVYLVFLGLLFVLVISLHAGKKLRWKQTVESELQEAEKE